MFFLTFFWMTMATISSPVLAAKWLELRFKTYSMGNDKIVAPTLPASQTTTTSTTIPVVKKMAYLKDITKIEAVENELVEVVRLLFANNQPERAIRFIHRFIKIQKSIKCARKLIGCNRRGLSQPFQVWAKVQSIKDDSVENVVQRIVAKAHS